MNITQKIIVHTEKLLSSILNYDVKIEIKPTGEYDEAKEISDIKNINSIIKKLTAEKSHISLLDKYYFTILYIKQTKPYISNRIIAEAFNRNTSTICKAIVKANDLLNIDDTFAITYSELFKEIQDA